MITKVIILVSVFLLPYMLFAQEGKEKPSAIFIIKSDSSSNEVVTRNLIMPFSNAKKFDIMGSEDVKERFPNSENLVVYVVTLNPKVKLVSLENFYKHRKVPGGKQKSLMVDGLLITDTSDVLIDETSVTSIDFKDDKAKIETLSKDKLHGLKLPGV